METDIQPRADAKPATPILRDLPPPQGRDPFSVPLVSSHTQEHPTVPPHTQTKSTLRAPDEFTRIFLLAWSVRYIPRGLLGLAFESNGVPAVKKWTDKFINWSWLNHTEKLIGTLLSEHHEIVTAVKDAAKTDVKAATTILNSKAAAPLVEKLSSIVHAWHGKEETIHGLITRAVKTETGYALHAAQKGGLRDLMRTGYLALGYGLTVFLGSSLLSFRYGRLVREDITNLFRESVAYEKNIPQEKVTFGDITRSDNRIVRTTIGNYHAKLWERLTTDSLFLLSAPLKSLYATDFFLGVKGVQMFRDTWKRENTMFEDLIGFVNNKINPRNGLGQPIGIGEVFDLYQRYAQAYAPERAFAGVIEHEKTEGARWAENQIIFQRMTELLNKTYAYKHNSIVDPKTGLSVLQADFALPKFIYMLGHDLIDVNHPKQTLVAIELANGQGIPAVKEMNAMLKAGRTLDEVIAHYHITLPEPEKVQLPMLEAPNAVIIRGTTPEFDRADTKQAPTSRIDAQSVKTQATLHKAQQPEATLA